MTKITYSLPTISGHIFWSASEKFSELAGKTFHLGKMEAVEIEKLEEISMVAKILLSAVAGAVIQHLLDKGVEAKEIFEHGTFFVKAE